MSEKKQVVIKQDAPSDDSGINPEIEKMLAAKLRERMAAEQVSPQARLVQKKRSEFEVPGGAEFTLGNHKCIRQDH